MRTLLAFPLLAGCAFTAAQVDPPLGQLARWRDAAPAVLAAEPVVTPCPADNPACATLHLVRAEACMGVAMAARAPGATCPTLAEAPHLACAGADYAAAVQLGAQPVERTALIMVGRTLGETEFRNSALYDGDYRRRFRTPGWRGTDE